MLPNQVLTASPLQAPFAAPKNVLKDDLADVLLGGKAFGDASDGMQYQTWRLSVSGLNIIYTPSTYGTPVVAVTLPSAPTWISGGFDQNMRVALTYILGDGSAYFYWFDSVSNSYATTTLPTGTTRPFMALDDNRSLQTSSSDVILSYVNGLTHTLYFRAQRDRYQIEYTLANVGPILICTQAGLNTVNRFQFEFQDPRQPLVPPDGENFVAIDGFPPVLLLNDNIKPRIWRPRENTVIRS
jgi:hypothetical protein